MRRSEKKECVENLKSTCQDHPCVIVVRQYGLNADTTYELRKTARQHQLKVRVVKNSLAALSFEDDHIKSAFKGPTALIMGADASKATKFVAEFSKKRENFFSALGALIDGKFYDQSAVMKISTLPALPEMRAQFLRLLNTPATNFVRLSKEPLASLARLLSAMANKQNQSQ